MNDRNPVIWCCSNQCDFAWNRCENDPDAGLPDEMQLCTNNATVGNFCGGQNYT